MRNNISKIIRDRIIRLEFRPGSPLNEQKLAEEFSVSRTPIREALILLSSEGLVNFTPNLGARVADLNLRDFKEMIEFRLILERGVARLAVRNATANDIQALEKLNGKLLSVDTDAIEGLMECDAQFHALIRKASHNNLVIKQMSVIQNQFTWIARLISYKTALLIIDLKKIIQALKNKDAAQLERLLVDHVELFVEALRKEAMHNFF